MTFLSLFFNEEKGISQRNFNIHQGKEIIESSLLINRLI